MQRVNGYNQDKRSYIMGTSALVSIAIKAGVDVDSNSVVAPIDELKRLYGINPSGSQYIDASYGWYKDGTGVQSFDYIIPTSARTFNGVAADGSQGTTAVIGASAVPTSVNNGTASADVAYLKAHYARANYKRIVDTIQQRAVILGGSHASTIPATAPISTTAGWNVNITAGAGVYVVTFLVERGSVFDKSIANVYGQPTDPVKGQALVEDLLGLSLYTSTGTLVQLTSATSAVLVSSSIPQIY